MEPIILFWIALAIIAIAGAITAYAIYFNKRLNSIVEANSERLRALIKLNSEIGFHSIPNQYELRKHYDNKSSFKKIEPAYLMTAELRAHMAHYAKYIAQMNENRAKHVEYTQEVSKIMVMPYQIDFSSLGISEEEFKKREIKILEQHVLHPSLSCRFIVYMTYTSPKGQVFEHKEKSFSFEQMVVSFNSISRRRVDRDTYSQLALVERGEVSDSLRYDVLRRDGFRCVICGASAEEGVTLHVDHIIPIAKGGKSVLNNLQTLCERCNLGKSDKYEVETTQEASPVSQKSSDGCPSCGGTLVLRKGKYGEFYGCSNYPKCKFTRPK